MESNLDIAEAVVHVLQHLMTTVEYELTENGEQNQMEEMNHAGVEPAVTAGSTVMRRRSSETNHLMGERRTGARKQQSRIVETPPGPSSVITMNKDRRRLRSPPPLICLFCGFSAQRKYRYLVRFTKTH